MTTLATLVVKLVAETAEFVKGMGDSSGKLAKFGQDASQVGSAMLPVSAAAGVVGVSAVKMAADFETSMAILQQTSGATDAEMRQLSQTAVALGADVRLPGTSANDAAQAMLELSKAGLSVRYAGGLAGVLQLSAAGQLSNAAAAEVTAAALNMFNLAGSEATRVADLLAAAANASAADVSDMADALKMGGSVAASAGVPIQDMTTALGLMANAGIKGSDAGTSLKTMLMRLMAPTDEVAALMEELGINVFDASGTMLPMPALIGQFSSALGGMSQEQRNAALSTIFGADAIRAANIVLLGGTTAWDKMSTAVNKTGAAQDLAAAQTTGLNGAMGGLQSTIETTLLTAGNPFLEMLTGMVNGLGNLVGRIGEADPMVLKIGMGLVAVLAAVAPLGLAIGALTTAFTALISPVGLVVAAIAAVIAIGVLVVANWDEISAKATEIWGAIAAWFATVWGQIRTTAETVWTSVSTFFTGIWTAISTTATTIWTSVSTFFTDIWTAISTTATTIWTNVSTFFTTIWTAISTATTIAWEVIKAYLQAAWTILSALAEGVFNIIKGVIELAWRVIQTVTEAVWDVIGPYLTAMWNAISTTATTIWTAISTFLTTLWNTLSTTAQTVWTAVSLFFTTIFTAISTTATTIWTAISTFLTTLWNTLSTTAQTVWTAVSLFFTTIFTAISTTATTIWTAISTFLTTLWTTISMTASTIWTGVSTSLTTLWTAIQTAAQTLWTGVERAIWIPISRVVGAVLGVMGGLRDQFIGTWQTIHDRVTGIVGTMIGAIKGAFAAFRIHIPLPHFSVSWRDIGFGVRIPNVGVNWYRKGADFLADQPTLIGVGEAGREHVQVTPWHKMGKDEKGGGDTVNIYNPVVREDQDIERLAMQISEVLARKASLNRRLAY